jgi:hypothetical protein
MVWSRERGSHNVSVENTVRPTVALDLLCMDAQQDRLREPFRLINPQFASSWNTASYSAMIASCASIDLSGNPGRGRSSLPADSARQNGAHVHSLARAPGLQPTMAVPAQMEQLAAEIEVLHVQAEPLGRLHAGEEDDRNDGVRAGQCQVRALRPEQPSGLEQERAGGGVTSRARSPRTNCLRNDSSLRSPRARPCEIPTRPHGCFAGSRKPVC